MNLTDIKALGEKLLTKRKAAEEFITSHMTDEGVKLSPTEYDEFQSLRKEIDDLGKQYDVKSFGSSNREAMDRMNDPANALDVKSGVQRKSIGERVTETEEFKSFNKRSSSGAISIGVQNVDAKTLMSESAGFAPPNFRTDIVIPSAQRKLTILDLIPVSNTNLTNIKYMVETTATNNAAARSEGGAAAESALAYTETSSPVQSIAHLIPVSDEQLEDVPMVQGIINDRLSLFIRQKLENYIISGTGTPPQITGILSASGLQTQAKGTDAYLAAFLKAITKVRISGGAGTDTSGSAEASAIVMHPTDFQSLALATDTTGRYLLGDPGRTDNYTIWGVTPTITTAIAQGTAIVGDFQKYAQVFLNKDVTIEVGWNADDFSKLRRSIRGNIRAALCIYRGGAFCSVTGL